MFGQGRADAGVGETDAGDDELLLPGCDDDDSQVPDSLACTGLYSDLAQKKLASRVRGFTPAYPLWSDGAAKERWIALPRNTKIDSSSPNKWVFPVGTKLWKEFVVGGKRVETRLFWKTREDRWLRGTYAWNAAETEATLHFGGDVMLPSGLYHLPEMGECDDCHKGQDDRVLGFGAVNLGLPGAAGITLQTLVDEGLLSDPPANTQLSIGADMTGLDDDGVPLAAKALGILHTNCGLPCHNDTPGRKANLTSQNLRLDVQQLDGRAPDETWNVYRTAVGKYTQGAQLGGMFLRIAPGKPETSHILTLMKYRNGKTASSSGQMPPIASRQVDEDAIKVLTKWITRLGGPAMDAGTDAGQPDAAIADAGAPDTGDELDAGMDAAMNDAGVDAGPDAEMDATPDAMDAMEMDAADGSDLDANDADAAPDADNDAADSDTDAADADSDAADADNDAEAGPI